MMKRTTYLLFHVIIFCTFTIQLSAQAQQKGGFMHNWANYPAGEFGSVSVTFDSTDLRMIEEAPPIGVHPRVFFGPNEVPAMRTRLTATVSGQAAMAQVHAYTTLLHLGYGSNGTYNHNASYGADSSSNKLIDNAGKWDSHSFYYDLINGIPTALDNADNKRRYLMASVMALEAFECLMRKGLSDNDTGLDYDDRAKLLGQAMSNWAQLVIGDANLNPNNYHYFGGMHMAMCYDLNYNEMTTNQRDSVRMALAAINPTNIRYGEATAPYATTSNWCGLNSFELVTNLAIEGEAGYNSTLTADFMRAYRNFITYGWYESGTPYEGLGKNYQFVVAMIPGAKRGYSLLSHPNVRAYGRNFLPAIMQPYGHAFSGTDAWGGSGWDVATGGYKFNAADVIGLKWMFPNDDKIDFVWRNYVEKTYNLSSSGYVYQQIYPATSGYFNYLLTAAMFADDYTTGNWETQNTAALGSKSAFSPERGLAVLRSDYDQDAVSVHFHCRQDLGGHTYADRNNFTLSGLGRIWMRYTYGSTFHETQYHNTILVNDLGVPLTPLEGVKARQPGTILNFSDDGDLAQVTGDATYAYSYEWHWQSRPPSQDHSWLGTNGWTKVDETWNDFRYQQGTETYHNTPFYDYDNWNAAGNLERIIKRPYNMMERVYRSVAMVRGEQPFVLIVDDVQKDSLVNNYKWLGQVASDLTIESTDVNLVDSDYRNDVIMVDPTGTKKLLVRVLNNNGQDPNDPNAVPAILETLTPGINGNNPVTRLVIEADVVAPDFKVLLFPFMNGDTLPHTAWNSTHDTLIVQRGNDKHHIAFEAINGRTHINMKQVFPVSTTALIEEPFALNIYPVPFTDQVQLDFETTENQPLNVQVFNALGQLVYSKNIESRIGQNKIQIPTNQWAVGSYFVQLSIDNEIVRSKMIWKK